MHALLDPWDPNDRPLLPAHELRVYADDRASLWAVVDDVDYQWAIQWLWNPKASHGTFYLKRNVGTARTPLYLHVAIMNRVCPPPSIQHRKVDHRNGNTLDCRRHNLRWATDAMNARNIKGCSPYDLDEIVASVV